MNEPTTTNYWILTSGRWTPGQLVAVVDELHRQRCAAFDGTAIRRIAAETPMKFDERQRHESQVLAVVQALEHSGFAVVEVTDE
jgi:hypothetical protein